jgi:hypothetical protein
MKTTMFSGAAIIALALLAAVSQQALSRGGGGRGGFGGFHGGDFGGGFRGLDHADEPWHRGGAESFGGTWHNDGYHAHPYYAGGYHGAYTVNHYYAGGCYACAGWGAAAGAAVGAAAVASYQAGTTVVNPPSRGCAYREVSGITYDVCGDTWLRPFYGNNGPYYKVVAPL